MHVKRKQSNFNTTRIVTEAPKNKEFKSLVSLLDDPDEEVFENVFQKLVEYGPQVIPSLESEWEHNLDEVVQERLENLIHTIQFDALKNELTTWVLVNPNDLLQGALIVNKFLYPEADNKKLVVQIEELKKNIWIELNYHLTPLEQVSIFNTIFYKHLQFAANTEMPHDPKNSFIGYVLESKKGNPIGIGLLYLLLAQQLHMPVYGVCLKNYFVLCYIDSEVFNLDPGMMNSNDILFYINPFNKGSLFKRPEIIAYLKSIKTENKEQYFNPATSKEVLLEALSVVSLDYQMQGNKDKMEELMQLKQILSKP